MIQDGDLNINVYTDEILLLMAEWDAEYCMDIPQKFYMREYYVIKYQSYDPDTLTYTRHYKVKTRENTSMQCMTKIQCLM